MLAAVFGTPFLFYARTLVQRRVDGGARFLDWDLICGSEDKACRHPSLLPGASGWLGVWVAIAEYIVAPIAVIVALRAGLPALDPGGRLRRGRSWGRSRCFSSTTTPVLARHGSSRPRERPPTRNWRARACSGFGIPARESRCDSCSTRRGECSSSRRFSSAPSSVFSAGGVRARSARIVSSCSSARSDCSYCCPGTRTGAAAPRWGVATFGPLSSCCPFR